jgi:hypothetical protein
MVGLWTVPNVVHAQSTELVSRSSSGSQAVTATQAIISATGRYVLFLAPPDLTDPEDRRCEVWHLRDRQLGTTEIVTRRPDGQIAECSPAFPTARILTSFADISEDGRFVLFDYAALNLAPGTTEPHIRAYRLDRHLNAIELVGQEPAVPALAASLSRDGSRALVLAAPRPSSPAVLRVIRFPENLATDIPAAGVVANEYRLADDGSRIVYHGRAPGAPTNVGLQIYVYDIATSTHILVSVTDDGRPLEAPDGAPVRRPAISGDGRVVAYESSATNQYPEVPTKIVARLIDEGRNVLVSRDDAGNPAVPFLFQDSASVSWDGSRIAFRSNAGNLPGARDGIPFFPQVYVFDLATSRITLASRGIDGRGALYGASIESCEGPGLPFPCGSLLNLTPSISSDGRFVAFHSSGTNLVADDANGTGFDVYVRDLGSVSTGLQGPRAIPVLSWVGLLLLGAATVLLAARRR